MKGLLTLLLLAILLYFLTSCFTVNVTQHMVSGHGTEKVSEVSDTETKTDVDTNVKGSGSLFGF
jgi:hypothetical protein